MLVTVVVVVVHLPLFGFLYYVDTNYDVPLTFIENTQQPPSPHSGLLVVEPREALGRVFHYLSRVDNAQQHSRRAPVGTRDERGRKGEEGTVSNARSGVWLRPPARVVTYPTAYLPIYLEPNHSREIHWRGARGTAAGRAGPSFISCRRSRQLCRFQVTRDSVRVGGGGRAWLTWGRVSAQKKKERKKT